MAQLTHAQQLFAILETERKEFLERFDAALLAVKEEVGYDGYFQGEDGTVYKITKPTGRYVKFDEVGFVRTKRGDEKQGTLSAKEARENGFEV